MNVNQMDVVSGALSVAVVVS